MKRDGISYRAKGLYTQKIKVMCMGIGMRKNCVHEYNLIIQSEQVENRTIIVYMYVCAICKRKKTIETVEIIRDYNRIIILKR